MKLAPILLFTYKRLDLLQRTIEALQHNDLANQSELFIFSDAAKKPEDDIIIKNVRSYLRTVTGFKKVTIHESTSNKGLANSIINGVTYILNEYEEVIVLEDDLITTSNFLIFMNDALKYYKEKNEIFSISGYNYNFSPSPSNNYDVFFVTRGCSWGWATWRNRWININWDINTYTKINTSQFKKSFNVSGSDFHNMLIRQSKSKIDSWAIRWYYNQHLQKKLTIYPVYSLIDNQGFDNDATHTKIFNRYKTNLMPASKSKFMFNPNIKIDLYYQKKIQQKFSLLNRAFWGRMMTILTKIF